MVLAASTGSCGWTEEGSTNGPLEFTRGHLTMMLAPLPEAAFFALPACVRADTAQTVRLESITPGQVTGASEEDITFLAAWPSQDQPLKIGAAGLSELEDGFDDYEGTQGLVQVCGNGSRVTGLEIATTIPRAVDGAVVVEDFTVAYSINGTRHTDRVTVTLGMCSSEPADLPAEPPECGSD